MRLPRWSFMSRFRLRIMFQNVANYLILLWEYFHHGNARNGSRYAGYT